MGPVAYHEVLKTRRGWGSSVLQTLFLPQLAKRIGLGVWHCGVGWGVEGVGGGGGGGRGGGVGCEFLLPQVNLPGLPFLLL